MEHNVSSAEKTFIRAVLDIIQVSLITHKWYQEKMGIFNCQLCKYISMEAIEVIEHVANKAHLEKMTSKMSLFEKKVLIFSLLDDLDVCKIQINSLDLESFPGGCVDKITKRNVLKALHLATLSIRSEEEKIDSFAKKQILQKKRELPTFGEAKHLMLESYGDMSRLAKEVAISESRFEELLAILNEYHWHQHKESEYFRCVLCATGQMKFNTFIFHVSSKVHLHKVCHGKSSREKKETLLEILQAVEDCEFRIKNFGLQDFTSSELSGFKRRVEMNLGKASEILKENLLMFEEQQENSAIEENSSNFSDCLESDLYLEDPIQKINQEEERKEDESRDAAEVKTYGPAESVSSNSFVDENDFLEATTCLQAVQDNRQIKENEDTMDKKVLDLMVMHNLWQKSREASCNLCQVELVDVQAKLSHFLGRKHLTNYRLGNGHLTNEQIYRELLNNVSNCEVDFKALNSKGYTKMESFLNLLDSAKSRFISKVHATSISEMPTQDESDETMMIMIESILPFLRAYYTSGELQCWDCNLSFYSIYNFISHLVGSHHISILCNGMDKYETLQLLFEFRMDLVECRYKIRRVNNLPKKDKVLLAYSNAIKCLEAMEISYSRNGFFPVDHIQSYNSPKNVESENEVVAQRNINVNCVSETIIECLKACGSISSKKLSGKFQCIACKNVRTGPFDFIVHSGGKSHINKICLGLGEIEQRKVLLDLRNKLKDLKLSLSNVHDVSVKDKLLLAVKKANKSLCRSLYGSSKQ